MSEKETTAAGDRLLQLIAVVLLGITTVGTAWCGFQAARWNGQSGDLNGVASEQRSRVRGSSVWRRNASPTTAWWSPNTPKPARRATPSS